MAAIIVTPEHQHARYAGVAQIVLGVATVGSQLDLPAPLCVAVSGIFLVLASPTNLARRASVNWWVCLLALLWYVFAFGSVCFVASGGLQEMEMIRSEARYLDMCDGVARAARRHARLSDDQLSDDWKGFYYEDIEAESSADASAAQMCAWYQWYLEVFPEEDLIGEKDGSSSGARPGDDCRRDCAAFRLMVIDDTSAFNQFFKGMTTDGMVAFFCGTIVVLAGCAWISSRAVAAIAEATPAALGLAQDLPDHRMSPGAAIVRGVRKTCTKAGRASRSEYWYYVVFAAASLALCTDSSGISSFSRWVPSLPSLYNGTVHPNLLVDEFAETWSLFASLAQLVFSVLLGVSLLFATTRRLHDTGRSGWRLLVLGLVPLGPLLVLFWLLRGSEPRRNSFGAVPTNGSAWEDSDIVTPIDATWAELTTAKAEIAQLQRQLAAALHDDAAVPPNAKDEDEIARAIAMSLEAEAEAESVGDCESPVLRPHQDLRHATD